MTLEGNPDIRNSQGGGIIGGGKAGSVILQHSATSFPFTVSTTEQRRIQFSAAVKYCSSVTLSVRFIGSSSLYIVDYSLQYFLSEIWVLNKCCLHCINVRSVHSLH